MLNTNYREKIPKKLKHINKIKNYRYMNKTNKEDDELFKALCPYYLFLITIIMASVKEIFYGFLL